MEAKWINVYDDTPPVLPDFENRGFSEKKLNKLLEKKVNKKK